MASNLRVDTILPSTGLTLGIGTASGTINFLGNSNIVTTGNVSIGGTLTYEDVTNVDSVGVITARSGIRLGATGASTLISGTGTGIGIGTITPNSLITIQDTGDTSIRFKNSSSVDKAFVGTSGAFGSAGTDDLRIRSDASNIVFGFSGSERLRIGSSGQLGIGGANYGTSGQVLTSQGNSSAVQWATTSTYTEYSTQTVGGASSYSITITGDPKVFEVSLFEIRHGNSANIMYRLSKSGGETSSGYWDISSYFRYDHGSNSTSRGSNQGQGCLVNYGFNGQNNLITGKAVFTRVNTGLYTFTGNYEHKYHSDAGSNDQFRVASNGHVNNTSAVTQFRIFTSNGANFTSGSINVRGIA